MIGGPEPRSGAVLRVADLFHPVDDFAVQRFLNGDMRHRVRRSCAVPVLLTGREPDDIASPDFLSGAAFALHPAAAGGHDQRLTQWMRMPGGPGAPATPPVLCRPDVIPFA